MANQSTVDILNKDRAYIFIPLICQSCYLWLLRNQLRANQDKIRNCRIDFHGKVMNRNVYCLVLKINAPFFSRV